MAVGFGRGIKESPLYGVVLVSSNGCRCGDGTTMDPSKMTIRSRMRRAFTLVEILIVVIILGILAAVVIPQFADASSDAKLSALQTNLATMRTQLSMYKLQHNDTWPLLSTFTTQMTLSSKADGSTATIGTATYIYGPYVISIPNNPFTLTNTVSTGSADSSAWYYVQSTGVFRANDTAHVSY